MDMATSGRSVGLPEKGQVIETSGKEGWVGEGGGRVRWERERGGGGVRWESEVGEGRGVGE